MSDDKPDAAPAPAAEVSPPAAVVEDAKPATESDTSAAQVDAKTEAAEPAATTEAPASPAKPATPDEFVDATDSPAADAPATDSATTAAAVPSTPPKPPTALPSRNGEHAEDKGAGTVELGSPIAEIKEKRKPTALQLDDVHAPPRSSIEVSPA